MSEGESPVLGSGMWFTRNTACLTARGQSWIGNIRPVDCRMQHHGSGNRHDGSNVALSDATVMVSADASESDDLFEVREVARKLGGSERF